MAELKCHRNHFDAACAAKAGLNAGVISEGVLLAALAEAVDMLHDNEGHTNVISEIHTGLIITEQSHLSIYND